MPSQGQTKRKSGPSAVSGQEKRTRVSRACDQCRVAREKCDGAQPICSTCSTANRSCGYTSNPKKRGIQPGYIRTLELALTWLFQNSDAEAVLNRKLNQEGPASVLLSRDSKESNKLHKSWRKSKFCRDVDKLLSGEHIRPEEDGVLSDDDDDSDIEGERTSSSFQQTSALPQQETPPTLDTFAPTMRAESLRQHIIEHPTQSCPQALSLLQQQRADVTRLVTLPSETWRLLEVYFTYTQCWLPICDKNDILKLSYSYPEQGVLLSPDIPDSGLHAELWSILAMASIQETSAMDAASPQNPSSLTPRQLYAMTKCTIPDELGNFEIGHIKALLNLAVFNLSQGLAEASWLLVGSASRLLVAMNNSSQFTNARQKHTFTSCFLLDNLLSIHLQRRPYLQKADIEQLGKIEEDGLEEWQPWTGCFLSVPTLTHRSSMPALSLSSFNNLVELTDILTDTSALESTTFQGAVARLDLWKSSLPVKFDYIRSETTATPSTPPALLLHLAYYSTALAIYPSQAWIQRALDLLDRSREYLGVAGFPPVIRCLIESIKIRGSHLMLDQRLHNRLQRLQTYITHSWCLASRESPAALQEPQGAQSRPSFGAAQMPTPDSIQISSGPSAVPNSGQGTGDKRPRTNSTLLEDLLPDMNSATATTTVNRQTADPRSFAMSPFENVYNPDPRNPSISTEVENFFDELASLDGAEKLGNRPQFMQNLGFAPDVNMADFLAAEFSQFIPMHSSTFIPHSNQEAVQFDQNAFYDGS